MQLRKNRGLFGLMAAILIASTSVACGDTGDGDNDSGDGDGDFQEDTFEAQVARGGELYGDHCAKCHGDAGQGTEKAPAVVGDDALPLEPPEERQVRTTEFHTAMDVFLFADEYMPGDDPGSLPDQDMVDVLAFALYANGVDLDEPLSAANADSVVINKD
jgi:cytochrome c